MQTFSSVDLRKQPGSVQRAASHVGAVITFRGKPRNVMLSVEEFCRLKRIAREAVPLALLPGEGVTVRHVPDPLGYDVGHFETAARKMADDALSGVNEAAVEAELAAVRMKVGRRDAVIDKPDSPMRGSTTVGLLSVASAGL